MTATPPQGSGSGGGGIDVSGSTGSMIYHNGIDWVDLAISTNGKILKIVGGIPSWQDAPSSEVTALTDLSDVTITTPSTGQVIRYNGSIWVNTALVMADISDLSASTIVRNNQSNTYTISGTQNFGGSTLSNIASVISNSSNIASVGFVRMNVSDIIAWRNAANTQDNSIAFSNNIFGISFDGSNLTKFGNIYMSMGTNPSATGYIRLPNSQAIAWRNAANSGDITITTNSSDNIVLDTSRTTLFGTFSTTSANPSTVGFIRFGNSQIGVAWRNSANTNNHYIRFNNDIFEFKFDNTSEYTLSASEADWLGNNLRNVGFLESNATNPSATGIIRLGNNEGINWRNNANTTDLSLVVTASDILQFNGTTISLAGHTHPESDITNLVSDLAGKQPLDTDLTTIAGLTPTNDDIMQFKAGAWSNRTIAQLKVDLALVKANLPNTIVYNDQDNTYVAGFKQIFTSNGTTAAVNFPTQSTSPSSRAIGDIWHSGSGTLKVARTSTLITTQLNDSVLNQNISSAASINFPSGSLRLSSGGVAQITFGTLTNGANYLFPSITSTDTIVMVSFAQALFNKDLTDVSNTFPNFPESQITNLVTDLAGKQPLDSDLTDIAALTPNADDILQFKASHWTNRSPAQLKTDLAIVMADISDLSPSTIVRNNQANTYTGGGLQDFGTSTVKSPVHQTSTANPSSVGIFRLANNESIGWRNAGNSADLLLTVNGSNVLQFNGTTISLAGHTHTLSEISDINGDRGDITVSGSTTWTIDNDTITFAKMQNIATDRLIGRDTAATGDPEEISVGGGIEFTGSAGIQTSAFTGDVTKSAGGTTLTIGTNKVLDTMLRQSVGVSIVGRSANTTGNVADITAGADDTILRRTSGALDFGQLTIGMFPSNLVTFAKFQTIATDSLLGRDTAGTGNVENILLNPTLEMDGSGNLRRAALTGDITSSAGSNSTTIPNNTVTYAKMQDVTATSRFIGRITAGAGDPEELTGTQATTLLDNFTSTLKGLAPASGGGTANFLRADGTWAAPTASITITQTEVDFGATPVADGTFTITNGAVSASSKILASVAYDAPTGKDLDEIEMDNLNIRVGKCSSGQFQIFISTADGSYLHDKFKINYTVG